MPKEFTDCLSSGGKVKTVSGPSKEHGLETGEYVKFCIKDGKTHRGEVHKKKKPMLEDNL